MSVPFREYEYVKRHSEELPLLERLWYTSLNQEEAREIVKAVCQAKDWRVPRIEFTLRYADRGYYKLGSVIQLGKTTNAEVVAHEVTHHGVGYLVGGRTRMTDGRVRWHGIDFVNVLDRTARMVAEHLERGETDDQHRSDRD